MREARPTRSTSGPSGARLREGGATSERSGRRGRLSPAIPARRIGPIRAEGAKLCDSGKGSLVVSGVPGRILSAAAVRRWAKQQRTYLASLNSAQLNAYMKANVDCGLTAFTGR